MPPVIRQLSISPFERLSATIVLRRLALPPSRLRPAPVVPPRLLMFAAIVEFSASSSAPPNSRMPPPEPSPIRPEVSFEETVLVSSVIVVSNSPGEAGGVPRMLPRMPPAYWAAVLPLTVLR